MKLFHYLHYGLAAVLVFVGGKMLLAGFYKIPTLASLLVIVGLLVAVVASLFHAARQRELIEPVFPATSEYQDSIKLREGLLVGFFLAGLVTLGSLQSYWLKPLIESLSGSALFFGATGLTALTDNAALTYLGSLVEGISDELKYALVAGAVAGGGLTVIANAPNPAGIGILQDAKVFNDEGISPLGLFLGALVPTLVAIVFLCFLR